MKFKRKINGTKWSFEIVTDKEMEKIKHSDCAACTDISEKTVYFNQGHITYQVVAHEMFHLYVSHLYLDSTDDLKLDQIEEIMADMFADKGEEMVRKARKITKDLKQLEEENE